MGSTDESEQYTSARGPSRHVARPWIETEIRRDERKRVAERLRRAAMEKPSELTSATIIVVAAHVEFMDDE